MLLLPEVIYHRGFSSDSPSSPPVSEKVFRNHIILQVVMNRVRSIEYYCTTINRVKVVRLAALNVLSVD